MTHSTDPDEYARLVGVGVRHDVAARLAGPSHAARREYRRLVRLGVAPDVAGILCTRAGRQARATQRRLRRAQGRHAGNTP